MHDPTFVCEQMMSGRCRVGSVTGSIRDGQFVPALMPSGPVADQDRMRVGRHLSADLLSDDLSPDLVERDTKDSLSSDAHSWLRRWRQA